VDPLSHHHRVRSLTLVVAGLTCLHDALLSSVSIETTSATSFGRYAEMKSSICALVTTTMRW